MVQKVREQIPKKMGCELTAGDSNSRMDVAGFRKEEQIILEKEDQQKEQISWAGSELNMIQKWRVWL